MGTRWTFAVTIYEYNVIKCKQEWGRRRYVIRRALLYSHNRTLFVRRNGKLYRVKCIFNNTISSHTLFIHKNSTNFDTTSANFTEPADIWIAALRGAATSSLTTQILQQIRTRQGADAGSFGLLHTQRTRQEPPPPRSFATGQKIGLAEEVA